MLYFVEVEYKWYPCHLCGGLDDGERLLQGQFPPG